MIRSLHNVIGKYAIDGDGNPLPSHKEYRLHYICHTGTEIWCQSPTGDSTDSLVFGHDNDYPQLLNRRVADRGHMMVTIKRELMYCYHSQMWYWFDTLYI